MNKYLLNVPPIMVSKLNRKYYNKRQCAKKDNIKFELTFEEYCQLANEAKITADDIGVTKYHLARIGDIGPYKIGNCRFLWYMENIREKKISEKSRLTSSINIKRANSMLTTTQIENRNKNIFGAWRRHWNNMSEEQKKLHIHTLPKEEIEKRHKMLIGRVKKKDWAKELSKQLGISLWGAYYFLKKYPIKSY